MRPGAKGCEQRQKHGADSDKTIPYKRGYGVRQQRAGQVSQIQLSVQRGVVTQSTVTDRRRIHARESNHVFHVYENRDQYRRAEQKRKRAHQQQIAGCHQQRFLLISFPTLNRAEPEQHRHEIDGMDQRLSRSSQYQKRQRQTSQQDTNPGTPVFKNQNYPGDD